MKFHINLHSNCNFTKTFCTPRKDIISGSGRNDQQCPHDVTPLSTGIKKISSKGGRIFCVSNIPSHHLWAPDEVKQIVKNSHRPTYFLCRPKKTSYINDRKYMYATNTEGIVMWSYWINWGCLMFNPWGCYWFTFWHGCSTQGLNFKTSIKKIKILHK